jgi:hypothetical protein
LAEELGNFGERRKHRGTVARCSTRLGVAENGQLYIAPQDNRSVAAFELWCIYSVTCKSKTHSQIDEIKNPGNSPVDCNLNLKKEELEI